MYILIYLYFILYILFYILIYLFYIYSVYICIYTIYYWKQFQINDMGNNKCLLSSFSH